MNEYFELWGPGPSLWGFIILVILIGSFFNYLQERSRNETIREAMRSGQQIDQEILRSLDDDSRGGGLFVGGFVTLAAALGLIVLGHQISVAEGEPEVFEILKGVAAIPGFIGVALILSGVVKSLFRKK